VLIIESRFRDKTPWGHKKGSQNKGVVIKRGNKLHDYSLLASRIKSKVFYNTSLREGLAKVLVLSQGLL
jgi:hypothetical protein